MSTTDAELHQRWIQQGDTAAFTLLVRTHSGMVYGTCRRILRNAADAEEVAQECFWKLAQTRKPIERTAAGWLHTAATRLSLNRLKSNARRLARDTRYSEEHTDAEPAKWDDVREHIDEAIAALPEELRGPLVLHYFEGRSHADIATQMGAAQSTTSRRIQRAVQEIRKHLRRKAIALSAAGALEFLAIQQASAAPAALVTTLTKIGFSVPHATTAGALSAAALVKVAAGLVAVLLVAGTWFATRSVVSPEPMRSPVAVSASEENPSETLERVATAEVTTARAENEGAKVASELPSAPTETVLESRTILTSRVVQGTPSDVSLDPAIPRITVLGSVIDARGEPVVGAKVQALDTSAWLSEPWAAAYGARTDSQGLYRIDIHRAMSSVTISVEALHFDSASIAVGGSGRSSETEIRTANFTLAEGLSLLGRVVNASGVPVRDALVHVPGYLLAHSKGSGGLDSISVTDEEGLFSVGLGSEGWVTLKVRTREQGVSMFHLVPVGHPDIQVLTLKSPGSIYGSATGQNGHALRGYTVQAEGWFRIDNSDGRSEIHDVVAQPFSTQAITDENGFYELRDLPSDLAYHLKLMHRTSLGTRSVSPTVIVPVLEAGSRVRQDLTTESPMRIYGRIVGRETGESVIGLQVRHSRDGIMSNEIISARDGGYELALFEPGTYFIYPGLEPSYGEDGISYGKAVQWKAGATIQLDLEVPSPFSMAIALVDVEGYPLTNASVSVLRRVEDGTSMFRSSAVDEEGRFEITGCQAGIIHWLHIQKEGYVPSSSLRIEGGPGDVYAEETVVLRRSGGIEAKLVDAHGLPIANAKVTVFVLEGGGQSTSGVWNFSQVRIVSETGAGGKIVAAEGLPEGQIYLSISARDAADESLGSVNVHVEIVPGAIVHLGDLTLQS